MKILFDQGTPVPLRKSLAAHSVNTVEQNLSGMQMAIVVLPTTNWPALQQHIAEIVRAIDAVQPGEYREIEIT
jgi:hypothetical protein